MIETMQLFSVLEASRWATDYIGKNVTTSNIAYLLQYGLIRKIGENGSTQVLQSELKDYYQKYLTSRENYFKEQLGEDLNWALSFEQYKEAETTKHVHRLHPYKGKFIPQLVEYFLDSHTDNFKTETSFKKGEIHEKQYGAEKEKEFSPIYENLVNQYNIKLRQDKNETFLDIWYSAHIRNEIDFEQIKIAA